MVYALWELSPFFGSVPSASSFHGYHQWYSCLISPLAIGCGHQTHGAKILSWFGWGPNWSPFPAPAQISVPMALWDSGTEEQTNCIPSSNGASLPSNWLMVYTDWGPFFQKAPRDTGHIAKKKRGKSHLEIIVALGQNVKEVQSGVCLPWERVWLKYMSLQPIFRQTDFSLCWLQSAVCLDACKFGGILYLKAKFGCKDQFSTVKSERRYFSRGFSYFCDRTSLYLLIKCSPHHGYQIKNLISLPGKRSTS